VNEWILTLRGALVLDTATIVRQRDRRSGVFDGFVIIIVVALLVGLPSLAISTGKGLDRGAAAAAEMETAADMFGRALQQAAPLLQSLPSSIREQFLAQVRQSFQTGAEIAAGIVDLPRILPYPIPSLLKSIGDWLSRPFQRSGFPLAAASLATWLGYGIWVMLSAKLLGGRGSLSGFLGATSLFAVPHILNIFGPVPVLGGFMGLVAFIWGLLIYIKGTAVSHEMTAARAFLAVILPILAVLLILLLSIMVGAVALIGLIAGNR